MYRLIIALVVLLLAAQTVCAQQLEPGRWRVLTTSIAEPTQPPMVATRCLTPEDVADPGKTFGPQVQTENSVCERKEFKLEPSGLTWRLECRGDVDMDVAGQFIFDSPTRYSAFITSKATMLGRIVNQTMVSISAERIGECR
jgi:hypothetical protein